MDEYFSKWWINKIKIFDKIEKPKITIKNPVVPKQIKVAFVGDSGVGKSSLVNYSLDNQEVLDLDGETNLVDIKFKEIKLNPTSIVNFGMWDFSGKQDSIRIRTELYQELQDNLENAKNEDNFDSQTIQTVEDGLRFMQNIQGNIRAMKDKIASSNYNIEMLSQENAEENEEDQQQGQEVLNLMANKDVLEQRGKALQEIHKTAALIKDTTDKMAQDLVKQGEMLDNVEAHVVKAEDNVEKAGKEIKKADELSKGNAKRVGCIIAIVVIAIGVVLAIVLSLVL